MKKLLMSLLLIFSVCSFGFSEKVTQEMIEKFIKNGTYILVNEFLVVETWFEYDGANLSYTSEIFPAVRYIKKDAILDLFLTTETFSVNLGERTKYGSFTPYNFSLAENSFSIDANGNIIVNVKAPELETEQTAIDNYKESQKRK